MIAYTGGTFDLFHVGHLELLRACREIAGTRGTVVAALNTDAFVERYKGQPPVEALDRRLEMVRACRYVDIAVVNHGDEDSRLTLEVIAPDVIVIGDDWLDPRGDERRYHAQLGVTPEWLAERHITISYIPRTRGTSTTLRRRQML